MNGNVISAAQAATILKVSDRRIRQLIAEGIIEASQFAGAWAVNKTSLMRYIAKRNGGKKGKKR